jgi:hypothetical protein
MKEHWTFAILDTFIEMTRERERTYLATRNEPEQDALDEQIVLFPFDTLLKNKIHNTLPMPSN